MNLFGNKYPYTNFHELNLDWIINEMKKLHSEWDDFKIVNNIKFDGQWVITKQYPAWTLVNNNNLGYISKKPVPAGISLDNTDYWGLVADYSALLADMQNRIVSIENNITNNIEPEIATLDNKIENTIEPELESIREIISANEKSNITLDSFVDGHAGSLNAHIYIDPYNYMFVCNYDTSQISIYDVNTKIPQLIGQIQTEGNPRDCVRYGEFLIVACTGDNTLKCFDISNIGTISSSIVTPRLTTPITSAPRCLLIIDDVLYCGFSLGIVSYTVAISGNNITLTTKNVDVTAGAFVTSIDFNGYGCIAAAPANGNVVLYNRALTKLKTITCGNQMSYVKFVGNTLYACDHTGNQLCVINTSNIVGASLITTLPIGDHPEQIIHIGNRLVIPGISGTGTPSHISIINIDNLYNPSVVDIVEVPDAGSGFGNYTRDYIYIDFHFSGRLAIFKHNFNRPTNIDIYNNTILDNILQ